MEKAAQLRQEVAQSEAIDTAWAQLDGAVAGECRRRLAMVREGLTTYRKHPYRRTLMDPPTIWRAGTTRLLDYGADETPACGIVVLFVPSLINRSTILDLSEERSLMRWLVGRGIRPLLVDWGVPGEEERRFGLTDYIAGRLEAALAVANGLAGGPVPVVGYCMGGLLALALAARQRQAVARLVLMATPWDFHVDDVAVGQARAVAGALESWAPVIDALGELPVDMIQTLFSLIDPMQVPRKFVHLAGLDPQSAKARAFVALEDWLNDGVGLAGPVAHECLGGWYGENITGRGQWQVGGQR
ncbi:MAG: alpha/beta fold hydrolase, partial [Alphaproteobacteria bacterium]